MSKNILKEKTLLFSVRIVRLGQYLTKEHQEYILSKQIMRSGTNPGAMCREAENAESKNDFIHKYKIAQKEIAETIYWLELLSATEYIETKMFESLKDDATQILKILISSINTARNNQ